MNKNRRIKTAVYVLASIDKVMVKKNGQVEVRRGFFYRHGNNAELFSHQIVGQLPGTKVIGGYGVGYGEVWKAWPKDSYWWAILEITDIDELFTKADAFITKADATWEEAYEELIQSQG